MRTVTSYTVITISTKSSCTRTREISYCISTVGIGVTSVSSKCTFVNIDTRPRRILFKSNVAITYIGSVCLWALSVWTTDGRVSTFQNVFCTISSLPSLFAVTSSIFRVTWLGVCEITGTLICTILTICIQSTLNAFSSSQWISRMTITRIGSICVLTFWISLTNCSIVTFIYIFCTGQSFPPFFTCAVAWDFVTHVCIFSLASTVWGTFLSIFSFFTSYKLNNESIYICKRWYLWVMMNILKACICCDMSCFSYSYSKWSCPR